MINKLFLKPLLLIIFMLTTLMPVPVSSSVRVSTNHNSDNINFENDNIAIRITGGQNVPKFEFWNPTSENNFKDRCSIMFIQMFESVDENNNNEYDFKSEKSVPQTRTALSSWGWSFSDITENDGETTFTLTSTAAQSNTGDFTIEFENHLGDNANSFKFDIKVTNYEFESDEDDAMLVLAYRLKGPKDAETTATGDSTTAGAQTTTEAENSEVRTMSNDKANFDGCYMDVETTAQTDNGDIDVGLSTGSDGSPIAFIAYSRFDGSFDHDPTLGFQTLIFGIPAPTFLLLLGTILLVPIIFKITRKE